MNETILLIIIILTIFIVISKLAKQKKRQKKASFNFEKEKEAAQARELKAKETLAIKKAKEKELMSEDFGSKKERQEAERKSHNARLKERQEAERKSQNERIKAGRKKAKVEREKMKAEREKVLAQRKKNDGFIEKYNRASILLKRKGILPLGAVIEKTGDEKRCKDFIAECEHTSIQDQGTTNYLYLVKIKSNVDDKKFIKVGITSYKDIKMRFEDDDVIEIIEVIRSIKLDTRVAMAIEFHLIQKHRPKDYFAEREFDVFSRFGGYTEVIPMRYKTAITKDIDIFNRQSKPITDAFNAIFRAEQELNKNLSLWSDLPNL